METIARPFGWLLLMLYKLVSNYGVAMILFAFIVRLVLLPFTMKSKKSMMQTTRLQPRLKALEKKYEGNQEKYQAEVAKIYKEEKINPLSGCIWSLIPFPILLALYRAIRFPITIMMGVSAEAYATIGEKLTALGYAAGDGAYATAYAQVYESQFITAHFADFAGISDKLTQIDYSFLGLDLGSIPSWKFWSFFSNGEALWPQLGLFLIPVISTLLSYLSTWISQKMNNTSMEGNTKTMMILMPLISLYIGFALPGALGLYWAAGTFFSIIQDVWLTKKYQKVFDALDAERLERERIRDEELEKKRKETERLRAENATVVNPNTSKRRIQAKDKQKDIETKNAIERERSKKPTDADKTSDSRVGDRPYARGRAYIADRYKQGFVPSEQPEQDADGEKPENPVSEDSFVEESFIGTEEQEERDTEDRE